MDEIRLNKQAESPLQNARLQKLRTGQAANFLHPFMSCAEQLKEADMHFHNHEWSSARINYREALKMLERVPQGDNRTLQYCLERLSYTQLRLFELKGALASFIRSKSISHRHAGSIQAETEDLMARIKAARKSGIGSDEDYSPRFYTGHL